MQNIMQHNIFDQSLSLSFSVIRYLSMTQMYTPILLGRNTKVRLFRNDKNGYIAFYYVMNKIPTFESFSELGQ